MDTNARLTVADSFRVRHDPNAPGRVQVRGWQLHRTRFRVSVAETLAAAAGSAHPHQAQIDAFLADAEGQISEFGPGFPRCELWHLPDTDEWRLNLALRPLPPIGESVQAALAAGVTVHQATIKGPNIEAFSELNRQLNAEALLASPSGTVTEGATTSVLWWEDGTLCRSNATDRVTSVTESLVCRAAETAGYPVASRTLTPAIVLSHTAWVVNALHGIRPITHLDGTPVHAAPRPALLSTFRGALDDTWHTLEAR